MGLGPDLTVAFTNYVRPPWLSSGLRCATWQGWELLSVGAWCLPLGSWCRIFPSPPALSSVLLSVVLLKALVSNHKRRSWEGTESYEFCSVQTRSFLKRVSFSICELVRIVCGRVRLSKPYTIHRFQRGGNGKEPLHFLPNLK